MRSAICHSRLKGIFSLNNFAFHCLRNLQLRSLHDRLAAGGVRTLIALHHGRKMKNKLFASCRGRVNTESLW